MNPPERRSYGTGSLLVHMGAGGKETWYGRWRVGKKRVKRRIGPGQVSPEFLRACRPTSGRAELRQALKAAGVREIRLNDLRHTFGTRMAAAGVPMRTLQEWMGIAISGRR